MSNTLIDKSFKSFWKKILLNKACNISVNWLKIYYNSLKNQYIHNF